MTIGVWNGKEWTEFIAEGAPRTETPVGIWASVLGVGLGFVIAQGGDWLGWW